VGGLLEHSGACVPSSHDEFLAVILGEHNSTSAAAFAAEILREYSPDQPRDQRGRWTAGGSHDDWLAAITYGAPAPSLERTGRISEEELQKIVAQLQASPAAKKLYLEAQQALFADKRYKAKGSLIINLFPDPKTLPKPDITTQPVPDVGQPNASNPETGTIWIDRNDPRENVFETLLVELAHITQRSKFIDLVDNAKKYTRGEFIRKMEEYEFSSMQRAAQVWKECWKDWNCPRDTPSWGNPDNVLKMTFDQHFKELSARHKEMYGNLWDNLTR